MGLQKDVLDLGSFDTSAFVVGFPLVGSFLQLVILPFCPDSPASLGKRRKVKTHGPERTNKSPAVERLWSPDALNFRQPTKIYLLNLESI